MMFGLILVILNTSLAALNIYVEMYWLLPFSALGVGIGITLIRRNLQ